MTPTPAPELVYLIGTYPEISTTFIDREIEYLRKRGFPLRVISIRPPDGALSPEQLDLQRHVQYLLPINWRALLSSHLYFSIMRARRYWQTLFFLLTCPHPHRHARGKTFLHWGEGVYAAGVLRLTRVRHIHAHFIDRAALVAFVASRLLDTTYSVTAHANDIFVEPILLAEKLRQAEFVVTVSQFNKAHLLAQVPGVNPDRLFVIPPPPNLTRFVTTRRAASRARRILSVGRLVEQKGHADLIRACALLKAQEIDFECHIVGDGALGDRLDHLIEELGLSERVQLLGAQPSSRVRGEYEWADVFVLACALGRDGSRDGIPVVLEEAMAMQLPVITTDLVGIRELVEPGAGVLVPSGSLTALAAALKHVLELSAAQRQAMGECGREIVQSRFGNARLLERQANLMRAALKC